MPTSLNTNPQTSFSTIVNTFKETQGFFKKDGLSLRMSGDNLHTKSSKPSRWGKDAKDQRQEKRVAAERFVTNALNTHLKKLGLGDNKGASLISTLRNNGVISSDRITVKDLKTIDKYLSRDTEHAVRNLVHHFDSDSSKERLTLAVNRSHDQMETFKQSGLDGLVAGSTWEMSEHGAGGAFMVTGQNNEKTVLKFDGENISNAEKSYQLLNAFRTGVRDSLPFVVPNLGVIDLPPNTPLRNEVDQKIQQEITSLRLQIQTARRENKSESEINKLEYKLERMEGKGQRPGFSQKLVQNPKVMKLERIDNAKQLNLLDVQTKHALLLSEQFGTNIGKSMVIMQFLGFNDHLHIGINGATNFSNLMVNPEGHIHLIDPSMNKMGNVEVGQPTHMLKTKMLDVFSLLGRCTSKNQVADTIKQLFEVRDHRFRGAEEDGSGFPLANFMMAVFSDVTGDGTFFFKQPGNDIDSRDEVSYMNSLSTETKEMFVSNVIIGMLEGMLLLDRNSSGISDNIENVKVGDDKVASYDSREVLTEIHNKLQEMGKPRLNDIKEALQLYVSELRHNI